MKMYEPNSEEVSDLTVIDIDVGNLLGIDSAFERQTPVTIRVDENNHIERVETNGRAPDPPIRDPLTATEPFRCGSRSGQPSGKPRRRRRPRRRPPRPQALLPTRTQIHRHTPTSSTPAPNPTTSPTTSPNPSPNASPKCLQDCRARQGAGSHDTGWTPAKST
jgi:hypothetical protein